MAQPKGTIDVRVLADGSTRAETGDMAGASHQAADNFLKYLKQFMGGAVDTGKVALGHHHTHTHADGTTHSHDDHEHA